MKLYIATFLLSMHKLCFFINIGENLVPFMGINILINVKKIEPYPHNVKLVNFWEHFSQKLLDLYM